MGRLKGEDAAYIYNHILSYHQLARRDRIWFQFKNAQEGLKGHNIIKRVYADGYKSSGDVGNYTDFNIQFNDIGAANWVLADFTDSLNKYSIEHPEAEIGNNAGNGSTTTSPDIDEPEKQGSSTTYIIIGVAAVAVILIMLLWDRKRK